MTHISHFVCVWGGHIYKYIWDKIFMDGWAASDLINKSLIPWTSWGSSETDKETRLRMRESLGGGGAHL